MNSPFGGWLDLNPGRWAALFVLGVWGWFVATYFRTMDWGEAVLVEILRELAVISVVALPLAFAVLAGVPWRVKWKVLVLLACICAFLSEGFARFQESLVLDRAGGPPPRDCVETRWWPFESSQLGIKDGKPWGCD